MSSEIHLFQPTSYSKPTFCDYCEGFLWGVVKQGHHCKCCGFNCHKKCVPFVESPCIPVDMNPFYNSSDVISVSSLASSKTLRPRLNTLPVNYETKDQTMVRKGRPSLTINTPSTLRPRFYSENPSVLSHIMKETAIHAAQMEHKKLNRPAGLNLMTTTPKNFTRFVARVGPLLYLQETALEILSWQDPLRSLVALFIFIGICLYPILLVVLPQFCLICFSLNSYYRKTKNMATKKSKYNENIQYMKNMQWIQNFMGKHAEIYDLVKEKLYLLSWNDENVTFDIMKYVFFSMFGIIILIKLIPLNYMVLVGGLITFFHRTPFFHALLKVMAPILKQWIDEKRLYMKKSVEQKSILNLGSIYMHNSPISEVCASNELSDNQIISESKEISENQAVDESNASELSGCQTTEALQETTSLNHQKNFATIYENQRWWAGLGWIPYLLRSERCPWTDEKGVPIASKDNLQPPEGYEWDEIEWQIDNNWSDTDNEGWVYSDHSWNHPNKVSSITTLTRRRKWIRSTVIKDKAE